MRLDTRPASSIPTPTNIPHAGLANAIPTAEAQTETSSATERDVSAISMQHSHAAARMRVLGKNSSVPVLPPVSAEELQQIIEEANLPGKTGAIDLAALLEQKGFQKTLVGLHFSDRNSLSLKGIKLDGIDFKKCSFDWSHLSESDISGCHFSGCTFDNVSFMNSRLRDCSFTACAFDQAMFLHADLSGVRFIDSTFHNSSFEDARIADSVFKKVEMPGTHFLNASVSQTGIERSKLRDTVFFDRKNAFTIDDASEASTRPDPGESTQPTTASLVAAEARGISVPLVGKKISGVAQTNLIRVAMQSPAASKEAVDREVEEILHALLREPASHEPFPQRLLKVLAGQADKYPNAHAILAKAKVLAQHVDSIVLPGGEDVSPLLYGEEIKGAKWDGDYRRSLMELGLIHESVHKEIPFMSICRGFQMTSAYFGARLRQHIGNEVGVRILQGEPTSSPELYGIKLNGMRVAVYHHQAVPDEGIDGMKILLTRPIEHDGETFDIVMLLASEHGAPRFGLQNHPEFVGDITNAPEQTNEALIQLGNAWQRPGSQEPGLRDPSDMVSSGILHQMSSDNDDVWKVIATAAAARQKKKGISTDALVQGKANLREPGNRVQPKRGWQKDVISRLTDVIRPQRHDVRSSTLTQLKAIAADTRQPSSLRKEAQKEIGKRIDPYAGTNDMT